MNVEAWRHRWWLEQSRISLSRSLIYRSQERLRNTVFLTEVKSCGCAQTGCIGLGFIRWGRLWVNNCIHFWLNFAHGLFYDFSWTGATHYGFLISSVNRTHTPLLSKSCPEFLLIEKSLLWVIYDIHYFFVALVELVLFFDNSLNEFNIKHPYLVFTFKLTLSNALNFMIGHLLTSGRLDLFGNRLYEFPLFIHLK